MRNLFAFTAYNLIYPEYISVNETEKGFQIVVRSKAKPDGSCGDTAEIELDPEMFMALHKANVMTRDRLIEICMMEISAIAKADLILKEAKWWENWVEADEVFCHPSCTNPAHGHKTDLEKAVEEYRAEHGIPAHANRNEDGSITVEPCCSHCHHE